MSASHSRGTKMYFANKLIGSLTSIDGVMLKNTVIDVSAIDSEDGYREKIAGPKDTAELTVSGYLDSNANHTMFYSAIGSAKPKAWPVKIEFQEAYYPYGDRVAYYAEWIFNGFCDSFKTESDIDSAVKFEATIKVTGKPEFKLVKL